MTFRKGNYTAVEMYPHTYKILDVDGTTVAANLNISEATEALNVFSPTPIKKRFKPIKIKGKPLSQTVIEDRI